MTEHKHAAVLRAIADGKAVEYKGEGSGRWLVPTTGTNPLSQTHLEWRIKPEPKPAVQLDARLELTRNVSLTAHVVADEKLCKKQPEGLHVTSCAVWLGLRGEW